MALSIQDPKTQKLLLVGILFAALAYLDFFTSVVPFTYKAGAADVKELTGQYEGLNSDLTKARQAVNSLPELEREYDLLSRRWQEAQRLLPDQQEVASLLRAVALLGDQSDVDFVLFRPLPPMPAQFHTEYPIEVQVEGGYHDIGTFLGELANMDRIVTVSHLEMERPKSSPNERPALASFVARSYTLGGTGVPPEEIAKDGGKGSKADASNGKSAKNDKKGVAANTVKKAKDLQKKVSDKTRGEEGSNE
jgi:type IV pilus assembly protein PilO